MYLLLGLLAAVLAGSMADAFLTDTDEDEADDARDAAGDEATTGDLIAAAFASGQDIHTVPWDHDPLDNHPLTNGMPGHEGPDASWRDPALDDGVHSSDALPAEDMPPHAVGPEGGDAAPPTTPDLAPDIGTLTPPQLPWDHDPLDNHPLANGMPGHEGPDASWRDPALDDGVHSSDVLPPDDAPPAGQVLQAGERGDTLRGGAGDDVLVGGAGADMLVGGGGADILIAGGGNNTLNGGDGDDTLIGGSGDDVLIGGWGNDRLIAGGGSNTLMGGAGDDVLVGAIDPALASGQNFLNGGDGDDILVGGGNDVLHGGPGADRFILGDWIGPGQVVTIMDYTPGTDRIELALNPDLHLAPDLSTAPDPADPDHALILLDGEVIARVLGASGLRAEDIDVIAEHPKVAPIRGA